MWKEINVCSCCLEGKDINESEVRGPHDDEPVAVEQDAFTVAESAGDELEAFIEKQDG